MRRMAAQSKTVMTSMPLAMCLNKKKGWRTISFIGGSSMTRRHFEVGKGNRVQIIHDFASEGFEQRKVGGDI